MSASPDEHLSGDTHTHMHTLGWTQLSASLTCMQRALLNIQHTHTHRNTAGGRGSGCPRRRGEERALKANNTLEQEVPVGRGLLRGRKLVFQGVGGGGGGGGVDVTWLSNHNAVCHSPYSVSPARIGIRGGARPSPSAKVGQKETSGFFQLRRLRPASHSLHESPFKTVVIFKCKSIHGVGGERGVWGRGEMLAFKCARNFEKTNYMSRARAQISR